MRRRLRNVKQQALALDLGVSQTTISRWESGESLPGDDHFDKLLTLFGIPIEIPCDGALRDLIEGAQTPVHRICDVSHRLLAASRPRLSQWRCSFSELRGRSLFRYTTPEITRAEKELPNLGWYDDNCSYFRFYCGASTLDSDIPIRPSVCTWERLSLGNGSMVRLVSSEDQKQGINYS